MKTNFLLAITLLIATTACSSTGENKHELLEAAKQCNQLCEANPKISSYTFKAGGGSPLLFIGGMEQHCSCQR